MENPIVRVIVLVLAVVILWQLGMVHKGKQTPKRVTMQPRDSIVYYKVQAGDTVERVAKVFDISVNTIKWENNLIDTVLIAGQTLKIPPVTGVVHTISEGDMLQNIAEKYNTTTERIIKFSPNKVAKDTDLVPGKTLYIPDGVKE